MSGEALYERYKDALRRGHVASLRGRLEEALTAYAEAAAIAPERATPHTSAGTALMRRKRPADAVRHYTAAVRLAPRDEAALLGRAQALTALDRRAQAADAYDAVADVQAANGKLADAVDSARRGLELAEGRERRRTLERLIERLRASEPAEPGRVALEKAIVVLEGRAIEPRRATPAAPKPASPPKAPAPAKEPAPPPAEVPPAVAEEVPAQEAAAEEAPAEAEVVAPVVASTADAIAWPSADILETVAQAAAASAGPAAAAVEWPSEDSRAWTNATVDAGPVAEAPTEATVEREAPIAEAIELEPPTDEPIAIELASPIDRAIEEAPADEPIEPEEPPPPYRPALDRDLSPDLDVAALARSAELTLERRIPGVGLDELLDLASAYRRDGRADAALDTCYLALSLAPDDVGIHLALVELYDERGWQALAGEKLDLLDRLTGLDEDPVRAARVAAARGARG